MDAEQRAIEYQRGQKVVIKHMLDEMRELYHSMDDEKNWATYYDGIEDCMTILEKRLSVLGEE